MNPLQNIAEEYAERIWNNKDLSAIDELLDPQIVIHSSLGQFQGKEAMRRIVEVWLTAFSNLNVKTLATISDQDLVVLHWEAKGTHLGEFKGLSATGKPVSYSGVTIYRLENGKITEYWAYVDMLHLLDQIKK